mmetsp:Transcript_30735/g.77755  ORF Transcript_30735/g.77755 Transcript_30735/m.77755 type:complete len:206 (+) Transcript_30735:783-1400(+)
MNELPLRQKWWLSGTTGDILQKELGSRLLDGGVHGLVLVCEAFHAMLPRGCDWRVRSRMEEIRSYKDGETLIAKMRKGPVILMFRYAHLKNAFRCVFFTHIASVELVESGDDQEYLSDFKVEERFKSRLIVSVTGRYARILLGECVHIVLNGQDLQRGVHDPWQIWSKISSECMLDRTLAVDGYHTSTILWGNGELERKPGLNHR